MITRRIESTMIRDLTKNDVWIVTMAGAPAGTDGVGLTGKGSLLTDTANGKLYINTGTKAAPTWTLVGAQT